MILAILRIQHETAGDLDTFAEAMAAMTFTFVVVSPLTPKMANSAFMSGIQRREET